MSDTTARTARMNFRLPDQAKSLIERAAAARHQTVSDYCLSVLTEDARDTLREAETLRLTEEQRRVFFDLLMDPPEPNERLRQAAAEHARRVVRSG